MTLVLLTALVSCGDDEPPEAPVPEKADHHDLDIPEDAPKLIVLGDSIAAGLHLDDPANEAFPAVMQRTLAERGLPFRLINAGVSGDTSAGGLRRLPWMLSQNPDLLVVELGANDGLRGTSLDAVEESLRGIVVGAREAGVAVLLLGHRLPPNLGRDYTERFAAVFDRIAKEFDLPYLPFFMQGVAGQPDLNFPDGIHPTAEGHRRLADRVVAALEPVLRQVSELR
ncbi:MAG: arylesterase [Planctomycetes bacterium]|nr:arylesterase [Planctomycetota bacterium]